jgi:hypothetical protein
MIGTEEKPRKIDNQGIEGDAKRREEQARKRKRISLRYSWPGTVSVRNKWFEVESGVSSKLILRDGSGGSERKNLLNKSAPATDHRGIVQA